MTGQLCFGIGCAIRLRATFPSNGTTGDTVALGLKRAERLNTKGEHAGRNAEIEKQEVYKHTTLWRCMMVRPAWLCTI